MMSYHEEYRVFRVKIEDGMGISTSLHKRIRCLVRESNADLLYNPYLTDSELLVKIGGITSTYQLLDDILDMVHKDRLENNGGVKNVRL